MTLSSENGISSKFDLNKNDPMAEALNNLLEYLERDERFKQGKYIRSVPRAYPDMVPANDRRAFETLDSAYLQELANRVHRTSDSNNNRNTVLVE